jgi:hypothetical protein
MPIPLICPCSAKLRIRDGLEGYEIQCPRCQAIHPVPGAAPVNGHAKASPPSPGADEVLEASGFSDFERARLLDELEKGEQLLWAGKPVARYAFYLGLVALGFSVVVALMLTVVIVGCAVQGAIGLVAGLVLGLAALAAVLLGATVPFLNRRRYERTAYALTDRRALVWDCDWLTQPRFISYGPEDLVALRLQKFGNLPDGIATLVFRMERGQQLPGVKGVRVHGFAWVRKAGEVERLIRERLLDAHVDRMLG